MKQNRLPEFLFFVITVYLQDWDDIWKIQDTQDSSEWTHCFVGSHSRSLLQGVHKTLKSRPKQEGEEIPVSFWASLFAAWLSGNTDTSENVPVRQGRRRQTQSAGDNQVLSKLLDVSRANMAQLCSAKQVSKTVVTSALPICDLGVPLGILFK